MTKVLIVSRQRLIGATNGSSVYLLQLAQSIRRAGMEPHLLQPAPDVMGRIPFYRSRPEMAVFESHRIRGVAKFGSWFISLDVSVYLDAALAILKRAIRKLGITGDWAADRKRPYAVAQPWTRQDEVFTRLAGRGKHDLVIADYAFQAPAFDALEIERSRCAIVMHDLFHARQDSGAGAENDSVALLKRDEEIELLSKAGAVIAIQQDEASFVREYVPSTRVVIAPTSHEVVHGLDSGSPSRLLFVGSRTAPNTHGLRWFLEHVWPLVHEASPDMGLDVVGTVGADFEDNVAQGVRVHGMVTDLEPFYREAGIVISPLQFGSGLKIKLVEAMAMGKPMVVTSVTLQGVEVICEEAVLRADEARDFADQILTLRRDSKLRDQLSSQAKAVVDQHFSAESAHAEFRSWLHEAAKGKLGRGKLLPPESRAATSCLQ